MSEADRARARLCNPDDPATTNLVGLVFDAMADRSARALADPQQLARHVAAAIGAAASASDARDRLVARLDAERTRWAAERRPLKDWTIPEADQALRAVLGQPWVPSEGLVYRLADHAAVRALLSDVLSGALSRFGQRLRTLDAGLLGGLGEKVAKRGKGLLGMARDLSTQAADTLVGGLRDEVEAALERRVREQVGAATDEALHAIAGWLAAPEHAASLASLRLSALDIVLDLPIGDLVGEVEELDSGAVIDALLAAVRHAAARDDLSADLADRLEQVLGLYGHEKLGPWLDDLGVRTPVREGVVDALSPVVAEIAATPAFEAWWRDLHR